MSRDFAKRRRAAKGNLYYLLDFSECGFHALQLLGDLLATDAGATAAAHLQTQSCDGISLELVPFLAQLAQLRQGILHVLVVQSLRLRWPIAQSLLQGFLQLNQFLLEHSNASVDGLHSILGRLKCTHHGGQHLLHNVTGSHILQRTERSHCIHGLQAAVHVGDVRVQLHGGCLFGQLLGIWHDLGQFGGRIEIATDMWSGVGVSSAQNGCRFISTLPRQGLLRGGEIQALLLPLGFGLDGRGCIGSGRAVIAARRGARGGCGGNTGTPLRLQLLLLLMEVYQVVVVVIGSRLHCLCLILLLFPAANETSAFVLQGRQVVLVGALLIPSRWQIFGATASADLLGHARLAHRRLAGFAETLTAASPFVLALGVIASLLWWLASGACLQTRTLFGCFSCRQVGQRGIVLTQLRALLLLPFELLPIVGVTGRALEILRRNPSYNLTLGLQKFGCCLGRGRHNGSWFCEQLLAVAALQLSILTKGRGAV